MRIPLLCTLSAVLMLGIGCSRDATPPAPAATTPAAPAPAAPAATPAATPAAAPATKEVVFGQEELDQMVAPLALYPDPLLAQVLMAATYPGDVAEAAAWSKAHPDANGDDAVRQVASQPWDPSVQSLVAFPQALATLEQDPAWVQRLGDAFLAQPDDVMDAVQRLRRQAQAAGTLESNEYQKVTEQPLPAAAAAPAATGGVVTAPQQASSAIIIEPSNPEVVYVPSYDPTTAYGTWAYPSYPPTYYPPPPRYYPVGSALASGLAFGVGLAITDSLWGGFDWDDDDWGHNDIDIDINHYNRINVDRQLDVNQNTWRHNSVNRDGVPYRDRNNREQYGRQLDGAQRRDQFRGDDAKRADARQQARASMEKRGVDAPARTNQEARDRAQAAAKGPQARDQARDRAQAATQGAQRDQARDRAQAATQKPQARDQSRDRAQAAQKAKASPQAAKARSTAQSRPKPASQPHRQAQSNTQARNSARQHTQSRQAPHNNAFAGASKPSASRSSAQRGKASHASAQRPSSARPAGKPTQRPSKPPQRQAAHRR